MFTARFRRDHRGTGGVHARTGGASAVRRAGEDGMLRLAVLSGFLLLGLAGPSSAQGLGTLQVTAQVVPATAAWTGLAEAAVAAQGAAREATAGQTLIRRTGLVHARAEMHGSGGRRLLLVTIHHPHN